MKTVIYSIAMLLTLSGCTPKYMAPEKPEPCKDKVFVADTWIKRKHYIVYYGCGRYIYEEVKKRTASYDQPEQIYPPK
jgi:hypothetical protein